MTLDDAKIFITAWFDSKTIGEVSRKTGLNERQVSNRAAHFRRRGIPLPSKEKNMGAKPGSTQLNQLDYYALKLFAMEQEEFVRRLAEIKLAQANGDKYRKHVG